MSSGALKLDEIRSGLNCRRIGTQIELVDSVTSTNDVAWERVEAGAPDGWVIFAEHQSRGRGRLGRSWESPRGAGVLCSVVVRDTAGVLKGGALGLLCSVAACDAIRAAAGLTAEIRWPNDLMLNGRKVGGVLVESRSAPDPMRSPSERPLPDGRATERQSVEGQGCAGQTGRILVAGIGINCLQHAVHFPPDLRNRATSLDMESPHPVDRAAVGRALLLELDRWLADPHQCSPDVIRDAWLQRATGLGQPVRLRSAGKEYAGVVLDVDPTSALVVQLDNGARMFFAADRTTVVET